MPPQKALMRERGAHHRDVGTGPDVGNDALDRPPQHLGSLLLQGSVLRAEGETGERGASEGGGVRGGCRANPTCQSRIGRGGQGALLCKPHVSRVGLGGGGASGRSPAIKTCYAPQDSVCPGLREMSDQGAGETQARCSCERMTAKGSVCLSAGLCGLRYEVQRARPRQRGVGGEGV